jgi:hypothetical protein
MLHSIFETMLINLWIVSDKITTLKDLSLRL